MMADTLKELPETLCQDTEGEFETHTGNLRQCRWLRLDNIQEKLRLNCGITQIGLNCLETCPCGKDITPAPTTDYATTVIKQRQDRCRDHDGEFETHMGTLREVSRVPPTVLLDGEVDGMTLSY